MVFLDACVALRTLRVDLVGASVAGNTFACPLLAYHKVFWVTEDRESIR